MAELIAILGESGNGKSTSIGKNDELGIIGLNPTETGIISCIGKPLPFKGAKSLYNKENGNFAVTRSLDGISKCIDIFTSKGFKNIVLDDFQYIMSGKYMDDAKILGYQKFTDLAKDIWEILNKLKSCGNENVLAFVLSHIELDQTDFGKKIKMKTIGKLLDDKITLEGLFNIVLYAEGEIKDDKVNKFFRTQSTGMDTAKSPYGMFKDLRIKNDLGLVRESVLKYYN